MSKFVGFMVMLLKFATTDLTMILFLLNVLQDLLVHPLKDLVDHLKLIQQLLSLPLNLNHHLKNGGSQTQVDKCKFCT